MKDTINAEVLYENDLFAVYVLTGQVHVLNKHTGIVEEVTTSMYDALSYARLNYRWVEDFFKRVIADAEKDDEDDVLEGSFTKH